MYREYDSDRGYYIGCRYPGQISVQVNGQWWSTVYWNSSGQTSTHWSDAALDKLSQPDVAPIDKDTFKNDVESWNLYRVSQCTSNSGTPVYNAYGAFENCNYPNWLGN